MVIKSPTVHPLKMKAVTNLSYLLTSVVLLRTLVFATRTEVGHQNWDGVGVYITVDVDKVQARIEEYLANNPGAPRLYVPNEPAFPFSGVEKRHHVSYFEFGFLELLEFESSAPRRAISTMAIPFLSTSEDGPPGYNLELMGVAEGSGDLPDPSLVSPYQEPDAIRVTATGGSWQNMGKRFAIEYNITACEVHGPISKRSGAVISNSLWLPYSTPDFGFCSRHPDTAASNQYCSTLKRILPDVMANLPNVCVAYESQADTEDTCPASVEITEITPGVREMLLLGPDDPINIVKSERFLSDSAIVLKYPCV